MANRRAMGHMTSLCNSGELLSVQDSTEEKFYSPPALANAAMDALAPLGIWHVDLPLTGEKLWRLMRDAKQEGSPGLVSKPTSSNAGPQEEPQDDDHARR